MNLADLFEETFRRRREAVALEFQGESWTFGELDERSSRMAHLLAGRGLSGGDRLCVLLANGVEVIDLYLACVKLGAIFTPINVLYKEREIRRIVADAEPAAVVAREEFSGGAPVWRAGELSSLASAMPSSRPPFRLGGDTPAAIVYTSGTTGTPKGAVLTHQNFAANARSLIESWAITSQDRLLLALPLFHVHGLGNGLHCWLLSGCRLRLLERFNRRQAGADFLDFRPTLFFGVPTMYAHLLETPAETARQIGASMRLFVSGSAPLSPQVLEQFQRLFGHVILERYGMTETLMNTSNPYLGERRPGSVGLPLPGVSIRLLDRQQRAAADGEAGEVCVRGPNVFPGYWRREQETRAAFVDGYFRTGDLAVRSPDGYFTLVGRASELIITGGFNVYPREIEELLEEQEEVAEAAVIGVPDRVRGEVPVAYIVARGPLDAASLEARCREKLAPFKVPRAFVSVESLPRTALGKVRKELLPGRLPDPGQPR